MKKGLFITFEGGEGCGKTTQIEILSKALPRLKIPVTFTREPGGTVIGDKIRNLLKYDKECSGMHPISEMLLFSASRAQLIHELILPTLQKGESVICDRFFDSTFAYQGGARGIGMNMVEAITKIATSELVPDLTILLDMPVDKALNRARKRTASVRSYDRMEMAEKEFYEQVRSNYLQMAAKNDRFVTIDASLAVNEVSSAIWNALKEKLHLPEINL